MENTLITYSTKYGATKLCAERIAARLPGKVSLADLDSGGQVDLAPYGQVIIGCSVYMGRPRKAARQFAKANGPALVEKRLGLYLCCIQDIKENVKEQMELAYGKGLLKHAAAVEALGGTVDFTRLARMDRMVMNMIAGDLRKKTSSDVISTISDERIDAFLNQLARG